VDELMKDNECITQREAAVKLGILQECADHIIYVLQYQRVCVWWVPHMLMVQMKASRA